MVGNRRGVRERERAPARRRIDTLAASVERTGRLVVVHEASRNAGLGAEIGQRITERCFYSLEAPVQNRELHEVRERDYFFIVSFSVWGLWAGMGIAALWKEAAHG